MKSDDLYKALLSATRNAYSGHPGMMGFAPFPDDIARQPITPYHCPCGDVLREENALFSDKYSELQEAIIAASPVAHWRETYKGTDIGDYFMSRFGCYSIIGEGGPFLSASLRLWIVYMPSHLYYPWHNHPAEEMYLVVSGSAVFRRKNCPDEVLTAGNTSFHASDQPHAMETLADPVLCLVAWRNEFQTPPVLTEQ